MGARISPAQSEFEVPDLKIPVRDGYARGQDGIEQILRAALKLLIEHGASALTLRRIAAECGLKAGNLAYYYRTKEDLIRELLSAIIGGYMDAFDAIAHDVNASPEDRLGRIHMLILTDITTKKTTRVFPELWAMSNHSAFVHDRVDEMYRQVRGVMEPLIAQIRPDLKLAEVAALALFMSASMEGMTMFAGFEKRYRALMPQLQHLAIQSFQHMVKAVAPGELKASAANGGVRRAAIRAPKPRQPSVGKSAKSRRI